MGSSTKKKKEKAKDFQKTKLKVGKARPKNTNATDTSFAAKSIVFKQQSVSETRDATALFNHNLSLLSSKTEPQRRDALQYLTAACQVAGKDLPQPASAIVSKAQPLILDGSKGVRQQLLKLFKALQGDIGPLEQLLLYTRAGMTHLSTEIRLSALEVLDWLLQTQPEAVLACPGGWVKTLKTFQNLVSWQGGLSATGATMNGKWSATKAATSLGSNKLLVHQLNTLATFLAAALTSEPVDPNASAERAAGLFPLWHTDAHMLPKKSNPFGYLNLFGAPRDAESEVYDNAESRAEIFGELGILEAFQAGVREAKKEGGEVGRAAALIDKALSLADDG
ncbi:hypothetical protein LTR36_000338 [Oleoguttula mirabilis]|uniref:Pre-rRNA-processing protein n=1 Tax=Oleoguttula mirabilis TaxID=1507867 RepID=A0AAV9JYM7_9PEZI|nr:hypothetical protein LTR36_000338 [Oleoguttula mirabilis]